MSIAVESDLKVALRLAARASRVKRLCRLAREYRLCYRDGIMRSWYRNPSGVLGIVVAFHHDKPVGSAVAYESVDVANTGVYVRRDYRRLGIGSRLFKRVFPYAHKPIRVWTGEGRDRFYEHAFSVAGIELKDINKVLD